MQTLIDICRALLLYIYMVVNIFLTQITYQCIEQVQKNHGKHIHISCSYGEENIPLIFCVYISLCNDIYI